MDHTTVEVDGEYLWRPANGQTLSVVVTEPPAAVRTGVSPSDVGWHCKVTLLGSPVSRPDSTAFVSDLHKK